MVLSFLISCSHSALLVICTSVRSFALIDFALAETIRESYVEYATVPAFLESCIDVTVPAFSSEVLSFKNVSEINANCPLAFHYLLAQSY